MTALPLAPGPYIYCTECNYHCLTAGAAWAHMRAAGCGNNFVIVVHPDCCDETSRVKEMA